MQTPLPMDYLAKILFRIRFITVVAMLFLFGVAFIELDGVRREREADMLQDALISQTVAWDAAQRTYRVLKNLGEKEFNFPFETLLQEISHLFPKRQFQAIFHQRYADKIIPEDSHGEYVEFPGNSEFRVKSLSRDSGYGELILDRAANTPAFQLALREGKETSFSMKTDHGSVLVALTSIDRSDELPPIFIVGYQVAPDLDTLWSQFRMQLSFATVIIFLICGAGYFLLVNWKKRSNATKFLATLSKTMGEGMYVVDHNGIITHINRAAQEMLGIPEAQAVGKLAHDLFHRDENEGLQPVQNCLLHSSAQSKQGFSGEANFLRGSGDTIPVWVTSRPFEEGLFRGAVTTFFDMSDIKKNEREQKLSELKYRTFVDLSPEMFFLKDVHGRYIIVNRNFANFFGLPIPHIIGKTDFDLMEKLAAERCHFTDVRARQSGVPVVFEEEIEGKVYETTKYTILYAGEIAIAGIMRNVTSRKVADNAILLATELTQKANQAKSEFLWYMSHEIRTPMNAILGLLESALEEKKDCPHCDFRKVVEQVNELSRMLINILNDTLDYSKIEANKLVLDSTSFSLRQLCQQVLRLFEANLRAKGVDAQLEIDAAVPPFIVGDELRLGQVLTNLMSNAVKFTSQGSVTLKIRTLALSNQEVTLSIAVHDTGIGMTKEQTESLFQPFMQAEVATARKYGGTGLGLAISLGIVQAMGSSIQVESTPGVGSTFSFTLQAEIAKGAVRAEQSNQASSTLGNLRILLAEDNAINQKIIAHILEKEMCTIDVASNGEEAVALAKQHHYDIILMDLQMPIMDGFEATAQIRHFLPDIPILALTAAALDEDREKVLQNGMNDHLIKPIQSGELRQVIARWAKQSES